ncbi:DUF2690 domain-containing protein [Amycolatopsis sp. cg5]|uniref:DUF2690 domain-containing protein n=1 Tax=Amycolatopsis sp. cg5 TaxID=3238802 RepID=UPI0035260966
MAGAKYRIRRALCVAMAAGMGLLGFQAVPAFAVSCSYNACNGKDPQAAGCSADARDLGHYVNDWGDYVELRHSPACGAVWTRLTTTQCQWVKPVLELGYLDYYGHYHLQGKYTRSYGLCNEGTRQGWSLMSSYRRERITYYSDQPRQGPAKTYPTGCNDCY